MAAEELAMMLKWLVWFLEI